MLLERSFFSSANHKLEISYLVNVGIVNNNPSASSTQCLGFLQETGNNDLKECTLRDNDVHKHSIGELCIDIMYISCVCIRFRNNGIVFVMSCRKTLMKTN